jgi:hypothetical protein
VRSVLSHSSALHSLAERRFLTSTVLNILYTDPEYHGKGAEKMMVQWGNDQLHGTALFSSAYSDGSCGNTSRGSPSRPLGAPLAPSARSHPEVDT